MKCERTESVTTGTCEYWLVLPNRVYCILRDQFDEIHADVYFDFIFSIAKKYDRMFYIAIDLSSFTDATPNARKRLIQVKGPHPCRALAMAGTNFATRTLSQALLTGAKLMAPHHFGFPHKFVDSLDEADAWFDDLKGKP